MFLIINHHIPSPECVCCFWCEPDKLTPVASEYSRRRPPPSSLHNILFVTLPPLRHRDRKPCSSRGTVVLKSYFSPSEVSTGHRTGHYNRSSDNVAVHSECGNRLYHTSMHYDLYSNHNALYYYVFSLFGLVAKDII